MLAEDVIDEELRRLIGVEVKRLLDLRRGNPLFFHRLATGQTTKEEKRRATAQNGGEKF